MKHFDCVNLKQYGDIYLRNQCAEDWTLPNIKTACERASEMITDPFGTTPVTNQNSGITYRNYYCAVCNRDSKSLQFWKPRLECPTLTGYSNRFKNITMSFIAEKLTFDQGRGQWGVSIDTGGILVFHECYIDPAVPDELVPKIRACTGKDTITDCPASFSGDPQTREMCQSYTAMVFEPSAAYR